MYGLTAFERDPFSLLDPFSDFDDRFVSKETIRSFKTDIREENDKFIMEAELPGFEKGEIQLDVNGDTLTLSAVHQQEQVDKSKEHYICRERSYGSYQRRFDISGIDADQIEAEYKNVLTIGIATIMDAKEVMIIASGDKKAKALHCAIEGSVNHMCPVSILQMHPHALIVCDEEATSELKAETVRYFKENEEVKMPQKRR